MKKPTLTAIGGSDVPARADAEEFYRELEIDVLARTLWGEARGEGTTGLEAVANVVLNRVKMAEENGGKFWWGSNIILGKRRNSNYRHWSPHFL